MVNIAQRGRSLGVHLFLATQRPAGVVTANIQANTDLRIALRVASPDDSKDVLDLPDAADISRRTPGRAFLRRIGHGTTELVQVAWVGAREEVGNVAEPVTIRPFAATTSTPVVATGLLNPRTDLDRLVATVTTAFTSAASKRPKRPWLPPLQTVIPLSELQRTPVSGAATGSVPIGMVDEPRQQRQATLVVDYARVGHLLVYGASRAGKTELLRVVAVASALVDTAVPPHVYGIDFAGGALSGLRNWPSVATVVGQSELPRVMRLLRWLDRTVRQRNGLLADRNVRDLDQLPEADRPPRIHVLIDNLPALLGALEGNRIHLEHAELLTTVLQDGRRAGVHVTATAPSRVALPTDVQSAFAMRLVLRMSSGDDYDLLGVPANVLHADSPPGRGLLDRTEVQIAVVDAGVEGNGPAVRARMQGQPPVDVPAMPSRLSVHDLPAPVGGGVPLAVDANLVEPVTAPLRGNVLLVAGRRGSGRTSVLNGIAAQARRSSAPPDRIVMVTPGRPLPEGRDSGFVPTGSGWSLLLIDDAHLLERDEAGTLYELVKYVGEAVAAGWGVVVASDSDHARIEAGELVSLARSNRRGVLLQAEAVDDGLLGAELPFATVEPLSGRGRGLWCWDGLARVVHVVTA
jgi:S-DNA-T family DNA segregation ATPase FtsK/SpoIIIE